MALPGTYFSTYKSVKWSKPGPSLPVLERLEPALAVLIICSTRCNSLCLFAWQEALVATRHMTLIWLKHRQENGDIFIVPQNLSGRRVCDTEGHCSYSVSNQLSTLVYLTHEKSVALKRLKKKKKNSTTAAQSTVVQIIFFFKISEKSLTNNVVWCCLMLSDACSTALLSHWEVGTREANGVHYLSTGLPNQNIIPSSNRATELNHTWCRHCLSW